MKTIRTAIASIAILSPLAAMAASSPTPLGPNKGVYGDWIAATYGTGSSKICYAFTKPTHSSPALSHRGMPMLTVSERHGSRDEISVTPGYDYPPKASVTMHAGKSSIPFYVQDNIAFTGHVTDALTAFKRENVATATSSGPRGVKTVTDSFSLRGFTAAYNAIVKACP